VKVDTLSLNLRKIHRKWYSLNAGTCVLGRLASVVAFYLVGKYKVDYSYNFDVGDYIVVFNLNMIRITGSKFFKKNYFFHSEYPGGLRKVIYKKFFLKFPEIVFRNAVKGMLPRNRLRTVWLNKLYLYRDALHPHVAQKPILLNV
jgi:large subunit ribosomal protein L13